MLNFITFGSGSSGNCYYLYTEEESLMIDVGVGTRSLKKHFKEYGLHLDKIDNILITHDHADHVKSVGSVSRDYGIPVYTTHRVHVGIENNYCVRCKISQERVKVIKPGETFHLGNFEVTSFTVPHDSTDNVGYRIKYGDVVFCIITDAGHITEEMAQYITEANYLVIEANHDEEMLFSGPYPQHLKDRIVSLTGHLSNKDCGEALSQFASPNMKHVWLCHLSEENNHPELARKTIEHVLRSYGIIPGKDFMLDVLKRKTPSEVFHLV